MHDWKTLLAARGFRGLWLALLCDNLGSWCVLACLPILVAERYGAGSALLLSLGLRIVPKVLLAPVAGAVIRRFGGGRVAGSALLGSGLLTVALPWCWSFASLQIAIAAIGTLDVFINPGLISLRSDVTPAGMEMAGNTLFSVADRLAKFGGPALGGLAVLAVGFVPAFLAFGLLIALAALPAARLDHAMAESDDLGSSSRFVGVVCEFVRSLRADARLVGLLLCAVSYMVMIGGLRPFLFWANRDWFGASDAAWSGLLAAQGMGALIGAVVSALWGRALLRLCSAYTLTLATGLLEGLLHLTLLAVTTGTQAMLVLALAGVPEILSTASWFTVLQERLSPRRQAVFIALSAPLFDCGYAVCVMSAGLHADGALALGTYWVMVSLVSTAPNLPLLVLARTVWRARVTVAS